MIKTKLLALMLTITLMQADNYQILVRAFHFNSPSKASVKKPKRIYSEVYGFFITHDNIKVGYYKNSEHSNSFLIGYEGKFKIYNTAIGLGLSTVTGYDEILTVAPNVFIESNMIRFDFFPTLVRQKLRLGVSLSIIF